MIDHTTAADLNKDLNELKEKSYSKDDGWFVKSCYMEDYGLSFVDAGLYTILTNLGKKRGYANPLNSTICNILGISERCLRDKLTLLKEKGILYIHSYQTRAGQKREMVTLPNSAFYYHYLKKNNKHQQLVTFAEEFLGKIPEPTPPPSPKKSAPAKSSVPPHPPAKSAGPGPARSADALNTTYLHNRTSDVTCKRPDGPADSNESCVAASSLEELRKELELSFSKVEADIGMTWYQMQSEAKRATMKKPIACIVKALQEGYAQEDVASSNKEIAAKLKEEKREIEKINQKRSEVTSNKKLADHIVNKFSHLNGWEHKIDSKGFSIINRALPQYEEHMEGTGLVNYFILPNGKKHYQKTLFVRVNFELPMNQFKQELRDFFEMCDWNEEAKRSRAQA